MIAALTGELVEMRESTAYVRCGPMLYEMLVPASDVALLQAAVGEETTFHTIFYIEGDSSGGNMEPRLIGFLRREDKKFFEKFTTVKGIGPKKALRALVLPVGEIARAIEQKDARFLVQLPQIGKRMAELIVAELAGKVEEFALPEAVKGAMSAQAVGGRRAPAEEDAISTMIALGERRFDAEHLLDKAKQANPTAKATDALVREMLRFRTTRSTVG